MTYPGSSPAETYPALRPPENYSAPSGRDRSGIEPDRVE